MPDADQPQKSPNLAAQNLGALALPSRSKIPLHRIDMAGEHCGDDENAYLVGKLRELNLYRTDLRYTVIHPDCLKTAEETGLYRRGKDGKLIPSIYCLKVGPDLSGYDSLVHAEGMFTWSHYAITSKEEARQGVPIIVYTASMLAPVPGAPEKYRISCPNKSDAILAIVLLDNYS